MVARGEYWLECLTRTWETWFKYALCHAIHWVILGTVMSRSLTLPHRVMRESGMDESQLVRLELTGGKADEHVERSVRKRQLLL